MMSRDRDRDLLREGEGLWLTVPLLGWWCGLRSAELERERGGGERDRGDGERERGEGNRSRGDGERDRSGEWDGPGEGERSGWRQPGGK